MGEIQDIVDADHVSGRRCLRHRRNPARRWRPERRSLTSTRFVCGQVHRCRSSPSRSPGRHRARPPPPSGGGEAAAHRRRQPAPARRVGEAARSTFVVIEEVEPRTGVGADYPLSNTERSARPQRADAASYSRVAASSSPAIASISTHHYSNASRDSKPCPCQARIRAITVTRPPPTCTMRAGPCGSRGRGLCASLFGLGLARFCLFAADSGLIAAKWLSPRKRSISGPPILQVISAGR